jgi:formyl-CoA transferase
MYDVMKGVRVVELAEHTFMPAAGVVLADWGADVIKVERTPAGDAMRHMRLPGADGKINPFWETSNRGKRTITLDLYQDAGRQQLYKLIAGADVFITNMRADARQQIGVEPAEVMALNPKIIYARGTGYGIRGPLSTVGAFDYAVAWCRAGAAYKQTLPGGEPPLQPGSIGDLGGGLTMAGGIAAALFRRERTGRGGVVDISLYGFGSYLMSQSTAAESAGLPSYPSWSQKDCQIPLANVYKTRDDRWISLSLIMDKWWPDFVAHLERPDLETDPRFKDGAARSANARALVEELNAIFAARDYADWCERFKTLQGVWAPVQSPAEVLEDPQAIENAIVSRVTVADGQDYMVGVSPIQFDEQVIGTLRGGPAFGQHTDEVLGELGLSPEAIAALRKDGAVA